MDLNNYTIFAKIIDRDRINAWGVAIRLGNTASLILKTWPLLFSVKNGGVCLFCLIPISQAKRGREWDF